MTKQFGTPRCIGLLATSLALSLFAFTPAQAADPGGQIATAAMHAKLASSAPGVDGVHSHLHHALNCLVGPKGDGFDAKEMNPCDGKGNGAIADATNEDTKFSLEGAADEARDGIEVTDIESAREQAQTTADALNALIK